MGVVTISGEPGCRHEDVARVAARLLGAEAITSAKLDSLIEEQFSGSALPDKAWAPLAGSIVARLAGEHQLVVSAPGSEYLFKSAPWLLRTHVTGPAFRRLGSLMLDRRLERPAAKQLMAELDAAERSRRRRRFGRATPNPELYDVVLNAENLAAEQMAELVAAAARARGIVEGGLLPSPAEAQLQFQFRLKLSGFGIAPPGKPQLKKRLFVHPSEEIFANLLDFYRIAWDYEPRSFPLQWDRNGNVSEAFTPDFYLPEFDMYVELTTMKQAHVTRKNRKIKLLRSIYPEINIQVFYQKDFQNLIFKYGLLEKAAENA